MKSLRYLSVGLIIALIGACSDSDDPNPGFETDLTEVATATENDVTVTLFAAEDLFVGFNKLTAKIENADGELLSGTVTVTPMMDMMTMSHSSPVEFPNGTTLTNGAYEFNSVFVMPSGEMGSWKINFEVNGTAVSVPIDVVAPEKARLVSFTSQMDETVKYFVAFLGPDEPQVGQNDLEIAVYKRESMMEWPAVTNLSFEVEPWMVSMDHGSPNNVAPTHMSDGHYMGKVNFTMTGDWQIRLTMSQDSNVCGEPYFDIYFQ
ncbi:MAG: FixH family protein [Cyclobacteriaceae bacterium]